MNCWVRTKWLGAHKIINWCVPIKYSQLQGISWNVHSKAPWKNIYVVENNNRAYFWVLHLQGRKVVTAYLKSGLFLPFNFELCYVNNHTMLYSHGVIVHIYQLCLFHDRSPTTTWWTTKTPAGGRARCLTVSWIRPTFSVLHRVSSCTRTPPAGSGACLTSTWWAPPRAPPLTSTGPSSGIVMWLQRAWKKRNSGQSLE